MRYRIDTHDRIEVPCVIVGPDAVFHEVGYFPNAPLMRANAYTFPAWFFRRTYRSLSWVFIPGVSSSPITTPSHIALRHFPRIRGLRRNILHLRARFPLGGALRRTAEIQRVLALEDQLRRWPIAATLISRLPYFDPVLRHPVPFPPVFSSR